MIFKKSGKQIFGVAFTDAEQKALDEEIDRRANEQLARYIESMEANIDAQLLWFMHEHEGHCKKRLIADFYAFPEYLQQLVDHYELGEDDAAFTARLKLKGLGVDIDELRRTKDADQNRKI